MAEETPIHAFAFDVFVLEVYPFNEAQSYTRRRLFIIRPDKRKEVVMVPSKKRGRATTLPRHAQAYWHILQRDV